MEAQEQLQEITDSIRRGRFSIKNDSSIENLRIVLAHIWPADTESETTRSCANYYMSNFPGGDLWIRMETSVGITSFPVSYLIELLEKVKTSPLLSLFPHLTSSNEN